MLLTEDEAKTKECRAVGPALEHFVMGTGPARCVASRCMHWRRGEREYEFHEGYRKDFGDGSYEMVRPDGDGWEKNPSFPLSAMRWRRLVDKSGYCGLAGRP